MLHKLFAFLLVIVISTVAAHAQKVGVAAETGIAGIHEWERVRAKTCIKGHWHYASGSGPTKKRAKLAAINDWENFTAWDYGWSWMYYELAESKGAKCHRVDGGWTCDVQARACKRNRTAARRKK